MCLCRKRTSLRSRGPCSTLALALAVTVGGFAERMRDSGTSSAVAEGAILYIRSRRRYLKSRKRNLSTHRRALEKLGGFLQRGGTSPDYKYRLHNDLRRDRHLPLLPTQRPLLYLSNLNVVETFLQPVCRDKVIQCACLPGRPLQLQHELVAYAPCGSATW
jgi:hypothetical protein